MERRIVRLLYANACEISDQEDSEEDSEEEEDGSGDEEEAE